MQEVASLTSIQCALRPKSTIMLDIDNTLLQPLTTYIGSDQWYTWQARLIDTRSVYRMCDTKTELNELLHSLYCRVPFTAVEEHHKEFVQSLKNAGHKLILVSARDPEARTITHFQLHSILGLGEFEYDLLLCGGKSKGVALKQYLKMVEPSDREAPTRIFVDDSIYNIVDVKSKLGGRVECFMYLGARKCVERFNAWLARTPDAERALVEEAKGWLQREPLIFF